MEIDEVRALAEQKNKKKTAKTTAKSPSVKKATARSSAGRETAKKETGARKETTRMTAQPARFGDSILDEVILLLIIVASIIVFISLLTERMGIIGGIISSFFKGLFGLGGLFRHLRDCLLHLDAGERGKAISACARHWGGAVSADRSRLCARCCTRFRRQKALAFSNAVVCFTAQVRLQTEG